MTDVGQELQERLGDLEEQEVMSEVVDKVEEVQDRWVL